MEEVGAVLSQRRQTVRVIETGEMIPMRTPDPLVLDAVLQSGAPLSFQLRGGLPRNRRVRRNRQTRASCLMPSLSPCGWASDKLPLRICNFPDLFEDFACEVVIKSGCGGSCSGIAHRRNILKVAHSLKALSASMSRSFSKPQLKRTSRHGSSVLCRMGSL